jgi:hypothetical protein
VLDGLIHDTPFPHEGSSREPSGDLRREMVLRLASRAASGTASRSRIRSSVRVCGARTDATTLLRQPEATLERVHAPPLVRHHDGRRPAGVQRRGNGDDVEAFPELGDRLATSYDLLAFRSRYTSTS